MAMQLISEPKLTIYNSSAGSGKTYTLATEYIKFALQDEFNYQRILAITFTNKATAEMKERILNFLQTLSKNEDKALMDLMITKSELSEKQIIFRSKKVLSRILHDFGFFSVNTIDSFFQKLIKSFAAELNIYINYEVIIDTEEVVEWVVDEMLVRSYDDKKLKEWIEKYVLSRIDGDDSLFTIKTLFETISKELFNSTIKDKIEGNHQQLDSIEKVQDLLKKINKLKTSFESKMDDFGKKGIAIFDKHTLSVTDFNGKKNSAGSLFVKILKENKNYDLPAKAKAAYNDSYVWYTKQRND